MENLRWWVLVVIIHGDDQHYHLWDEPTFVTHALEFDEWLQFETAEGTRVRLRVEDISMAEWFSTDAVDFGLEAPPSTSRWKRFPRKKKTPVPQ